MDGIQLPAVVLELPADRIARRIIDVTSSSGYRVTCGRYVITGAILHVTTRSLLHIAAFAATTRSSDVSQHFGYSTRTSSLLEYFCYRRALTKVINLSIFQAGRGY